MNINDYISSLENKIHSFQLIASYNLNIDRKSDEIAFVSGKIEFRDGSILDLKEFIECTEFSVRKYNYRIFSKVIFRYDNAPDPHAKKLDTYPHHKHQQGKILESKEVNLFEVLEENEN
ncbi:hypothetical protein GF337_18165 [candidate division KSB1 bacterium]|nr:hypothetical protein [candidate division KSB1 bacterium]